MGGGGIFIYSFNRLARDSNLDSDPDLDPDTDMDPGPDPNQDAILDTDKEPDTGGPGSAPEPRSGSYFDLALNPDADPDHHTL